MTEPNLLTVHNTGRVVRYHATPEIVHYYNQTDAEHVWGCLALLFILHPSPSMSLVSATVFHDAGEYVVGDLPGPSKSAKGAEVLAAEHFNLEQAAIFKMGLGNFSEIYLTNEDKKWLKMVDRLEALIFVITCGVDVRRVRKMHDMILAVNHRLYQLGEMDVAKRVAKDVNPLLQDLDLPQIDYSRLESVSDVAV